MMDLDGAQQPSARFILIPFGTLESKRVMQALHATLDPPAEEWNAPFARMAAECRLELSASEAFRILVEFYTDL